LIALFMLSLRDEILVFGLGLLDGSAASYIHAARYFEIKIWGAPGVLATMVFTGWLVGTQNTRAALILAAIPSLLHAVLDLIFVVVLELGIAGAAYAALTSAYFSMVLGIWLVMRVLSEHGDGAKLGWQWRGIRRLLTLNWNILLRTLCLIATFAFFTKQGASQGDTILAANAILLNFQMLMALGLDGFANALEALVGSAIGASDRSRFRASVVIGTLWSLLFAVLFAGLYSIFGTSLIALLTDIEAVRSEAGRFLVWAAVSPLVSVWCFVFDGIFIGATKGPEMRNSMLFSAFGVFLPAWYLLQPFGNHGLWGAFVLFFAARGVSMGWYYARIERSGGFA
jgi:MATE family multidrug resistance protein